MGSDSRKGEADSNRGGGRESRLGSRSPAPRPQRRLARVGFGRVGFGVEFELSNVEALDATLRLKCQIEPPPVTERVGLQPELCLTFVDQLCSHVVGSNRTAVRG